MSGPDQSSFQSSSRRGEIFFSFLRLGLTSFGGPIAHIGYFRREFVEQRKWVSDAQFAQLLALCQFLPGPASSQLGFALGLVRGRWPGALLAFCGFTLPSALLLFAFAVIAPRLTGQFAAGLMHGLKLVALVVVTHGVIGMAQGLCRDIQRILIALSVVLVMLLWGGLWLQIVVVIVSAVTGILFVKETGELAESELQAGYRPGAGLALFLVFALFLFGLPYFAHGNNGLLATAEAFYRAGAMVFGGGHVVLPFLEQAVVAPGWVTRDDFMVGYGAAQAVPGPMFTVSAYLGAHLSGATGGLAGAAVALISIFLPGFLLISAALPLWNWLTAHPAAARSLAGVNAAVVGLLAAALYDPIWTSSVRSSADLLIAAAGYVLLAKLRLSAIVVVFWCVLASVCSAFLL